MKKRFQLDTSKPLRGNWHRCESVQELFAIEFSLIEANRENRARGLGDKYFCKACIEKCD
jgi:hypothetical protein